MERRKAALQHSSQMPSAQQTNPDPKAKTTAVTSQSLSGAPYTSAKQTQTQIYWQQGLGISAWSEQQGRRVEEGLWARFKMETLSYR